MSETQMLAFPKLMRVERVYEYDTPVNKVFEAVVSNLTSWWGHPYCSQTATDFILEPEVGGRFYEVWTEDEGSLWGVITRIQHNQRLEITGSMGMAGAVQGKVVMMFGDREGCTFLSLTHSAVGDVHDHTAREYQNGWDDLLGSRLKDYVEKGVERGLKNETPVRVLRPGVMHGNHGYRIQ